MYVHFLPWVRAIHYIQYNRRINLLYRIFLIGILEEFQSRLQDSDCWLLSCSWHQTTNLVSPNFFHEFFSVLVVEKEKNFWLVPNRFFLSFWLIEILKQWSRSHPVIKNSCFLCKTLISRIFFESQAWLCMHLSFQLIYLVY